ncbi:MAG: TolC family outer membrane protein [Pseudomonadales bacterium]|nr:TolC family outer membrane protein [Pseudomonadales bacterium]
MNKMPAVLMLLVAGLFGQLAPAPVYAGSAEGPAESAATEDFPDTTLAGIYELAVRNDLTIAQARAQLRAGVEERRLARAGLLPRVQGTWDYVDQETDTRGSFAAGQTIIPNTTNTATETYGWDISLSQPLFDLPAWFRFQQGKALSEQAQATFSVAQQELIVRTASAYFEVLRAAANLRASRAQESAVNAQLDQVKQRFEVGMVAITDVHEAQAAYDLAVAQRIFDEGQLGTRRELLSVLTGRPHGDLWMLDQAFPVRDPDPVAGEEWVDFARQNNLDIQVAQYARDAAARGARAATSTRLPTVDLSLMRADSDTDVVQRNLGTGTRNEFPNDQERTTIALRMTLPIYTGGFTTATIAQANARADAQQSGYEGTVRTVLQETRAMHIRVRSDVARAAARAQAVTSTRSALEAAQVGYEVGTRNVVDVLNAQREYFSAVRDYENSIVDYVLDLVVLKRVAGMLSPADIYDINQWLREPAPATLSGAVPANPA